jgi:hypothetical protein
LTEKIFVATLSRMAGKPKKPEKRKSFMLRVRMTEAENAEIERAAERSGLGKSTWARVELLRLARQVNSKK